MYKKIIGKSVYSFQYGTGIITSVDEGLIWVNFNESNKLNVCFQASAAFAPPKPFLTSQDPDIQTYLQEIKAFEEKIKHKRLAVEVLKKLNVPGEYIDDFKANDTIYYINGKEFIPIFDTTDEKIKKGAEWLSQKENCLVYAAVPVPKSDGRSLFTYAYLCIDKCDTIENLGLDIWDCYACGRAFFQNINFYDGGEFRIVGLHITDNGIYSLPEFFTGALLDLKERKEKLKF